MSKFKPSCQKDDARKTTKYSLINHSMAEEQAGRSSVMSNENECALDMEKTNGKEESKKRRNNNIEELSSNGDEDDGEKVLVEFYDEPRSVKQRLQLYFVTNRRSSLCIRLISVLIKLLACLFYVIRVVNDRNSSTSSCYNCSKYNAILNYSFVDEEDFLHCPFGINFDALLWVDRTDFLWAMQTLIAAGNFLQTVLVHYINFKGSVIQLLTSRFLILDLVTSVPFVITAVCPSWRKLFVPAFLNCWTAKFLLQDLMHDLHRAMQKTQSALSQRILVLLCTAFCLIFTSSCGVQHLQRAGRQQLSLFQSFYFVAVTLSTVGYGDIYPDTWISQLFVIIMICVAFVVLPSQLEQLLFTWVERQKAGGEYSKHRAKSEKHVVVCSTNLRADTVLDFLNEFYADPMHDDYFVVLLSPCELDATMRMVLQIPVWAERVIYIRGSALRANDLERAKMDDAKGCFILAARNYADKHAADQHAILRSWAVRDYAPNCKQYVQIFRPENKIHVKHAEVVVCEDEFKYALLANNCICPGISTFITLLLHTSRGEEGQASSEQWHRVYGRHSGNEIYHIQLSLSKFFSEFEGKSFTYASFHAHKKYGVCLVAVQRAKPGSTLQLNPGPRHTMKGTDVCYYISITREEQMTVSRNSVKPHGRPSTTRLANTIAGIGTVALELQRSNDVHDAQATTPMVPVEPSPPTVHSPDRQHGRNSNSIEVQLPSRRPSIAAVPDVCHDLFDGDRSSSDQLTADSTDGLPVCKQCNGPCELKNQYRIDFPPVAPYIGTSATLCYLSCEKKRLCCLQLAQTCEHCSYSNARAYNWSNPAIILAADHASNGIYNFIIPLRAHYIPVHRLFPIVLLLEQKPSAAYLDAISWFPMLYWMHGNIESIDNLLRAGINLADHVVVVNKETSNSQEDDYLADCNTIVAVQTMYRMFPAVRIITELTHSSNMRFMQFNAKDLYALHQSQIEKKEKERGSCIAYMFRLPFAAGNVFSATMLDTLLYQTFSKEYLAQFVRLLLGIDQSPGSGHLSAITITEEDLWIRTYGRLYQKLCSSDGDIPLGIFRTQVADTSVLTSNETSVRLDMRDITDIWKRKYTSKYLVSERHEIANLVKCRMESLGLPTDDYSYLCDKRNHISYVVINPSADLKLEAGDVVYALRPDAPLLRHSALSGIRTSSSIVDGDQICQAGGRRRRARFSDPRRSVSPKRHEIASTVARQTTVPKLTVTKLGSKDSQTERLLTEDNAANNGSCPTLFADDDVSDADPVMIVTTSPGGKMTVAS